jgi:hypothetical protein
MSFNIKSRHKARQCKEEEGEGEGEGQEEERKAKTFFCSYHLILITQSYALSSTLSIDEQTPPNCAHPKDVFLGVLLQ